MQADSSVIRQKTGGYISASPLEAVPGVMSAFGELLGRVQALPFVPATWRADVEQSMAANGNRLWIPAPAIRVDAWRAGKTEPVYPDTPSWIVSNNDARVAWNTLVDWWTERMQPILAGWSRSQAEIVRAASNDAAFWNSLYKIVQPVAMVGQAIMDAPAAVAGAASSVALGTLRALLPILAIVAVVAVGVLVYKNKITGK